MIAVIGSEFCNKICHEKLHCWGYQKVKEFSAYCIPRQYRETGSQYALLQRISRLIIA